MKRVIYSSVPLRYNLTKPSLKNYVFKGEVMEDKNMFRGNIVFLAPYDDADYWWAKIGWNGADLNEPVELIQDGKVKEKFYLKSYLDDEGEDNYEDVYDYIGECAEIVADKLKVKNAKIKPVIIHN